MAETTRTILHVDMDAFFAAVEQHDNPALIGKPVVVGAPGNQRGVVAAASYEARKYGIHSAMPSRQAFKLCPDAVFLPVNGKRYGEVSRQVFGILERFTPLVEPVSIDEAFMDVTGSHRLFGTGREIAAKIKDTVKRETGLTASVGIAPNKFLAKLASDLEKPDGLTVVPFDEAGIESFLAPLSISRIWGVGKVTQKALEKNGISEIRHLQAISLDRLASITGMTAARHLKLLASGRDDREVEMERDEKSISREHTFLEDCTSKETLEDVLCDLADDVGRRLRAAGRLAALAHMKLRWQGFTTITRQKALPKACCDDFSLREAAIGLFRSEPLIKPVRLIGFGVSRLSDGATEQLSLFEDDSLDTERKDRLSRTVDEIRKKFGDDSIGRGH